ncbi:MAG: DNA-processing protein DprA [Candidatus Hydrogenedentes bacterium]|nr:DNA-processing protein DprA [Candidatus Hydrogenedentota bacterium]
MEPRDIAALLALMRVEGAGNATGRRALSMAQFLGITVSEAIATDPRDLLLQLPANAFDAVLLAARQVNADSLALAKRHAARILHHGVRCSAFTDENYPELLSLHLGETAPALIWCAGNFDLLRAYSAGIVGTRTPSHTGEGIAADCARLFAREGICVVSGGADGIDTAAHRAALDANGSTVIVLPQGIRRYSFPAYVRDAIESNQCVLISQFDPEMAWQTHAAVTRNATIAALSKLVCVIEPRHMGGSMRTAAHTHEQSKPLFHYCESKRGAPYQSLTQYRASPLLSNGSSLDSHALLEAWRAAPGVKSQQAEFDTCARDSLKAT